mmetsp:Transcript_27590/g.87082  ORF Transcript_27590/g.87082 Transcript_27590/m.87082 type:complete len:277 (+) Transcript_27590:409-1239(+)
MFSRRSWQASARASVSSAARAAASLRDTEAPSRSRSQSRASGSNSSRASNAVRRCCLAVSILEPWATSGLGNWSATPEKGPTKLRGAVSGGRGPSDRSMATGPFQPLSRSSTSRALAAWDQLSASACGTSDGGTEEGSRKRGAMAKPSSGQTKCSSSGPSSSGQTKLASSSYKLSSSASGTAAEAEGGGWTPLPSSAATTPEPAEEAAAGEAARGGAATASRVSGRLRARSGGPGGDWTAIQETLRTLEEAIPQHRPPPSRQASTVGTLETAGVKA